MSQELIPSYVRVANQGSNFLFDSLQKVGSLLPAVGYGATIGYFSKTPCLFTLCCAAQDIFLRYISPHTIEKVFFNRHSNGRAQFIGTILAIAGTMSFSYGVTKLAINYFQKLKDENTKSNFTFNKAAALSITPMILTTLYRAMQQ